MRRLPLAFALAALASSALRAQAPLPGYSRDAAQAERAAEADVIKRPTAATARTVARDLSKEPHVAGTPAQARTRDYAINLMKSWGLETEVRTYDIWMPHPVRVRAWRLSPAPKALPLEEPKVASDPSTVLPQYPTVNGYSGAGDVKGEVVYVNYGLIKDYAQLAAAGISVKGKIAIARYGRSFRGIKAREAEKRGAVGLIIYSDPQQDGFVQGDVFPDGPWRPGYGVQRGSVFNGAGDPTTPGWPSTPGAKRITPEESSAPKIPVIPMGYANAAELLRGLKGAKLPDQSWQGGLDFRYHVGPGPVQARLEVVNDSPDKQRKNIYDTFGIVRGSEFPEEIVMIGGHRDGWGPGAEDNISGTTAVLETAHAVADLVKTGWRPRRTLMFATWDAEEWGLIGSSEYVEDDSLRLMRGAVAYLNLDNAASGPNFSGGGSPSLRQVLRDIARQVPRPDGTGNVYDVWRQRANLANAADEPAMGDPGGGSDFAGFYNHLGIPHIDWNFTGVGGGIYHSAYDTHGWMSRFGDSTFAFHATSARIGAAMMLRLAQADLHPYDYVEFARTMRRYYAPIDKGFAAKGWRGDGAVPTAGLAAAVDRFESAAQAWANARDSVLAAGRPSSTSLASANARLREVEKSLTRAEGLVGRPWYRNLIYVADVDNGYANMVFPSVNEAIRYADEAKTRRELADLAARFDAASSRLAEARAALGIR
ncbi:MAG: M28 family peptidase [Gemmatimonadetes bacterium]|nr:M28 family peptidase [Gemmatimonadota bacterium]